MTDQDKKELQVMNNVLNRWANNVLDATGQDSVREYLARYTAHGLRYRDGTKVQFQLKDNQNIYRYFSLKGNKTRYCWTPHKDTQDWYWTFNYTPKGNTLKVTKAVKFRKRKAAIQRATYRYDKANS